MIIRDLEHLEVVNKSSVIGGAASSFQETCYDIQVLDYDSGGALLTAYCEKIDGSYQYTELELRGIANIDGNLSY